MNKHTFYSYLILGMTFAFVFSAQAQNKVSAPMKDVNQVIDNTPVSYTHLTLPTTSRV